MDWCLDGDVVCDDPDDTEALYFDIQGDDLGILIGRRGLTLSALQYLVRLMVLDSERMMEKPMARLMASESAKSSVKLTHSLRG